MIGEMRKREFDPKVEAAKIAGDLRKLADQIESEGVTCFSRIDVGHYLPVASFNGGMITDQQFLGWTIILSTMSIPRDLTDDIRKMVEGKSVPFEVRFPKLPNNREIMEEVERMRREGPMVIPRSVPTVEQIDFGAMPLAEVVSLRDRLNTIIYDKERGK